MHCPEQSELDRFLHGDLADVDSDRIAEHVDDCESCQRSLTEMEQTPDPVLALLADRLRPEAESTSFPELSEIREQIRGRLFKPDEFPADTEPGQPKSNELPTRTLGQYELLELLGQGGMGSVYKARHVRLQRLVALKLLPDRMLRSPDAVARFDREMRAAGALHHPNIVHATDAGEVDGHHFIAMECVDGPDVSSLARQVGPMRIADACEIVRQAALGLQHAHDSGLIHRDVKPSNLILSREGTVKLLDLGLARIQTDDMRSDELTSTAQIMGTVDYMAPEQADNSHEVDVRADIYSLGATLFRLLSGVAPLDTHDCRTPIQKLTALVNTSRTPITKLRSDVPAALVELIQSMLAKAPDDRPPSAASVAHKLQRFSTDARLVELVTTAFEYGAVECTDNGRVVPRAVGQAETVTLLNATAGSTETVSPRLERTSQSAARSQQAAGWSAVILVLVFALASVALITSQKAGWIDNVAETRGTSLSSNEAGSDSVTGNATFTADLRKQGGSSDATSATGPDAGPSKSDSREFSSRTEFNGRPQPASDEASSPPIPRTAVVPFSPDEATQFQHEWASATGHPVEVTNSIGMTLRLIPIGEFQQGSSRVDVNQLGQELEIVAAHEPRRKLLYSEVPPHLAWIDTPFYMASTEVTQAQFRRFVKASGYVTQAEKSGRGAGGWIGGKWVEDPEWIWSYAPHGESRDDHSVVNVSWNDAKTFCQWLSDTEGVKYDLPTETQWEFACRAGSLEFYPSGELEALSWFKKNSENRTHRVATKEPNSFGLHDMIGNVYEWCDDWYTEYGSSDPRTDRVVAEHGRTRSMRSGAFHSDPDFLRPAHRLGGEPGRSYYDVGFRVIRVAERGRVDHPQPKSSTRNR